MQSRSQRSEEALPGERQQIFRQRSLQRGFHPIPERSETRSEVWSGALQTRSRQSQGGRFRRRRVRIAQGGRTDSRRSARSLGCRSQAIGDLSRLRQGREDLHGRGREVHQGTAQARPEFLRCPPPDRRPELLPRHRRLQPQICRTGPGVPGRGHRGISQGGQHQTRSGPGLHAVGARAGGEGRFPRRRSHLPQRHPKG